MYDRLASTCATVGCTAAVCLLIDGQGTPQHRLRLVELSLQAMQVGKGDDGHRGHRMLIANHSLRLGDQFPAKWNGLGVAAGLG